MTNEYELEGLHFHWGDKNNRGSEHVLNDIRYPMEMHIIHRNKKYKDMPEAIAHPDGLCVLGFFYQLKETESPELMSIVRNLSIIEEMNQSVLLNSTFALTTLLGDLDTERFYTYKGSKKTTTANFLMKSFCFYIGSLTTPPCSEAVTWVIFPDPLPVSVVQVRECNQMLITL